MKIVGLQYIDVKSRNICQLAKTVFSMVKSSGPQPEPCVKITWGASIKMSCLTTLWSNYSELKTSSGQKILKTKEEKEYYKC